MSGSDLGPGWTLELHTMPQIPTGSQVTTNEDFFYIQINDKQNCAEDALSALTS